MACRRPTKRAELEAARSRLCARAGTLTASLLPPLDAAFYAQSLLETAVCLPPQRESDDHAYDIWPPNAARATRRALWLPTGSHVARLVRQLEQQAYLQRVVVAAIARRNAIIDAIASDTCFGVGRATSATPGQQRPLSRQRIGSSQSGARASSRPQKAHARAVSFEASRGGSACSSDSHVRLAELLASLDDATDAVVAGVALWRVNLRRPQPFLVDGHNCLLLVLFDLEAVVAPAVFHLVEAAGGAARYTPRLAYYFATRYAACGSSARGAPPLAVAAASSAHDPRRQQTQQRPKASGAASANAARKVASSGGDETAARSASPQPAAAPFRRAPGASSSLASSVVAEATSAVVQALASLVAHERALQLETVVAAKRCGRG